MLNSGSTGLRRAERPHADAPHALPLQLPDRYGQLYVNSEVLIENARTYLWGKNPQTCAKVRTFWWVFLPHLMDTEGAKNPPKCANLAHFDLSAAAGSTGLLICERR